jgi:hypothetical protein
VPGCAPEDYAFFEALLGGASPEAVAARHALDARRTAGFLKRLEELGVLDRLPAGRVRLRVQGTHNWLHGGPMQRRFITEENIAFVEECERHLATAAQSREHFLTSSERRISKESLALIVIELRETFARFRRMAQRDELLEPSDRLTSVRWLALLAPRPGTFERHLDAPRPLEPARRPRRG